MEVKQLKIAVVGKSSAGKSAFIRFFGTSPELINLVGKGQTTHCYGEYVFRLDGGGKTVAEAQIASKEEFCEW